MTKSSFRRARSAPTSFERRPLSAGFLDRAVVDRAVSAATAVALPAVDERIPVDPDPVRRPSAAPLASRLAGPGIARLLLAVAIGAGPSLAAAEVDLQAASPPVRVAAPMTVAAAATADAPAAASDSARQGGVAQLERFVASTPQATGRFTQTIVKDDGSSARPSSGVFAYARPGRFRWDIEQPYEQLIVTDGKELNFYDKDLQQVTVRPVSEAMSATPAALLFGGADIERAFRLTDDPSADDGLAWVQAVPLTKEAGFERLRIGLRNGVPARMDVVDAFGQQTRFVFSGIDPKAVIPSERFRFVVPPGVDVVR